MLEDGPTAPANIDIVRTGRYEGRIATMLRITIHEGRKRQVRRMLESVGHRVVALHRSGFGNLTDAGLAPGQVRPLSATEIEELRRTAFAR